MKLIIRVDDVGLGINKRVDVGMKDYSEFHAAFRFFEMPYCPCIIPKLCDGDGIAWMIEEFYPEVTPCLHGWDHEANVKPDNEFGGRNELAILNRIRLGIYRLYPLTVFGMSAPWNRYDDAVLNACTKAGLSFFLAGYGREKIENFEIKSDGLVVFPAEATLYVRSDSKLEDIKVALETLKEQDNPYVLTLHCTWEYPHLDNTFKLLKVLTNYEVVNVKKWLIEYLQ